jgi:hypothetical protein
LREPLELLRNTSSVPDWGKWLHRTAGVRDLVFTLWGIAFLISGVVSAARGDWTQLLIALIGFGIAVLWLLLAKPWREPEPDSANPS